MIKEPHWGISKKKGQATLITQVACPFSSAYSIKANKYPFEERFLLKVNEEVIIMDIQQIIAIRLMA